MDFQLLGKTLKPTGQTYILPKDGDILKAYNSQDKYKKPIKVFKNYNIYMYGFDKKSNRYYMDCFKVTSNSTKYIFLFRVKNKAFLMCYKKNNLTIVRKIQNMICSYFEISYNTLESIKPVFN